MLYRIMPITDSGAQQSKAEQTQHNRTTTQPQHNACSTQHSTTEPQHNRNTMHAQHSTAQQNHNTTATQSMLNTTQHNTTMHAEHKQGQVGYVAMDSSTAQQRTPCTMSFLWRKIMADAISSAVMATVRRSGCPEVGLRVVLNHPCSTASCTTRSQVAVLHNLHPQPVKWQ